MKKKIRDTALLATLLLTAIFFSAKSEIVMQTEQGECLKADRIDCIVNGVLVGYGSTCICGGTACIANPCAADS